MSLEPSEPASSGVALHRGGSRLNHAVYDQLKERLLEGRYTAGERLSTEALRTEFGVSKQPVMEALRRLAGDGLIEVVPQVGSRVATYSPREVSDFFVMFGGFEGTIASIAALRRTARSWTSWRTSPRRSGPCGPLAQPVTAPTATAFSTDASTTPSTKWRTRASWPTPADACGTCLTS